MTPQKLLDDFQKHLETIRDRVQWLYDVVPDTIQTDVCLLATYENHFGKLHLNQHDSIKRAGRYWRNVMPQTYSRSKEKIEQDNTCTIAHKEVFA